MDILRKTDGRSLVHLIYASYNPRSETEKNSAQYRLFDKICETFSDDGLTCSDTDKARQSTNGLRKTSGHYNRLGNIILANTISTVLDLGN